MSKKAWLRHYDEGVPHTLRPYPESTLLDIVVDTIRQRPDHPAMLFEGKSISFSELDRFGNALATALVDMGTQKGDRVALLLPNSPQMVFGEMGIWKAGGIAVPVNPLYTERELEFALNECGALTVIVLTPFYQKVKNIQPQTSVKRVITTNIKEYFPFMKRFLFSVFKERKEGHRISLEAGDMWLQELLSEYARAPRQPIQVKPADPAVFLFTGGTTGTPKCAVGTHHALVMAGMQLNSWFRVVLEEWEDRIMLNMPLFHSTARWARRLIGWALSDDHYPEPRDQHPSLRSKSCDQPCYRVPTMFISLMEHPSPTNRPLAS
jgi:long-chain acyl-CoA synthetase